MLLFDWHCTGQESDRRTKPDNCLSSNTFFFFIFNHLNVIALFCNFRQTEDSTKEMAGPKVPDSWWNSGERGFSYLFDLLFHLSSRHLDLSLTLSLFNMCKLSYVHQRISHLASFVVTKAARQMCGRPPVVRDAPSLTAQRSAKTSLSTALMMKRKFEICLTTWEVHSTSIKIWLMNMYKLLGMMMMWGPFFFFPLHAVFMSFQQIPP